MLVISLPLLLWFGARVWPCKKATQPAALPRPAPEWLWLTLAAVLVVSVLRNLPGAPFALLRP